ncbi:ATP-dependent DNA helicase Q4 [Leptopilina heterotoma]|uniref:ATP-dependent DNA helicase Q4 n=1 Tax=Leptopilina heterotoma TaxID=63436 RepID=UPI001CA8BC21|nr:ATP-dependent DNA helicase Q4 [Leptopilina heterotoma]
MELFDDPKVKRTYLKSKIRVKQWESNFMEKYGRKPNKNDIREADIKIRHSYKTYWNLKTQALDETLTDITFDEESNTSMTSAFSSPNTKEVVNDITNLTLNSSTQEVENSVLETSVTDTTFSEICLAEKTITESPPDNTNVKGVWGDHLSNKNLPKRGKGLSIGKYPSFQLSQKMFKSSSFSKKNPRKSLSMSRIKSKDKIEDNLLSKPVESTNDGFDTPEITEALLGEKMKIIHEETKISTQSLNTIQQLIEGRTLTSRTINQGWLERCGMKNQTQTPEVSPIEPRRLSGVSDSGVESMESSIHSLKESVQSHSTNVDTQSTHDSDEDFVLNSDSEEERRSKRIRNFNKFSCDIENLAKRPCFFEQPSKSSQSLLDYTPCTPRESEAENSKMEIVSRHENLIEETPTERIEKKETEELPKTKRTHTKRKGRRKMIESDEDSDPEYSQESKKKMPKRTTKVPRAKKSVPNEPTTKTRATRKSTKQKENVDQETVVVDENDVTFGIESLDVVPRLPMKGYGTGDLITDFSKVLAGKNEKENDTGSNESKLGNKLTAKDKLEQKMKRGELNDNYVRVNLKKKVFVRGKKSFNFSKFKKGQWKQRKKDLSSSAASLDAADFAEKTGGACHLCGEMGHFARQCKNRKGEELLPLEQVNDKSEFPTLEEAEEMARRNALIAHSSRMDRLPKTLPKTVEGSTEVDEELEFSDWEDEAPEEEQIQTGCRIPKELIEKLLPPEICQVKPVYPLGPDNSLIKTPDEVFKALKDFGHDSFRPGQEKAVMRILSGQSTLLTLSTGSGKSLCYQLPAYIYAKKSNCITLVISPLVSLMDDQVTGIPSFLSAACLHTNQSEKVRGKVMDSVRNGKLSILLVSPEAVVAGEKSTGFGALFRQLPPIAFACIDEAHCISQWSHNFRPSYLMVSRVLKEKLGVKTILGLTATATNSTAESIVNHLNIQDKLEGIISDVPMPSNLILTISRDENRNVALIDLLKSERFEKCDSIIVYCTRREECVRIAGLIRVSLQVHGNRESGNVKVSKIAEAYHAGLSAYRRKIVQKSFMSGETRIVVATVAFGMGINKSNIRSVIHFNMPASFENYVQEIGRAGRDGLPAHCHLFIDPGNDVDKWELRRHIFSNGVDRRTIRLLLQKIFVPCSCVAKNARENGLRCPGHEVAIPIDETVQALDITEETISTLLCYLELHPKRFITVLSSAYCTARVSSYGGTNDLKFAAQTSPPLAMAIAQDMKKGKNHENSGFIEFPVIDVAATIGWDSGIVKNHLKNLEWTTVDGKSKRSSISVRYSTLGLRVRTPGDLTEEELDTALNALVERTSSQETMGLKQIEAIHTAVQKYSVPSIKKCLQLDEEIQKKSEDLKEIIRSYFKSDSSLEHIDVNPKTKLSNETEVINDIRILISSYRDTNFSARAIARIFHGIQSPNYPAVTWGRCRFWRSHLNCDFNLICQLAVQEILAMHVGS